MAQAVLSMILSAFFLQGPATSNVQFAKKIAEQISHTTSGHEFLMTHPRDSLEKVISFTADPKVYFHTVERIPKFYDYLALYFDYAMASERTNEFPYIKFVHRNFDEMDKEKVPILTFLLLSCEKASELEEELAGIYTESFGQEPELYAQDLRTRKNLEDLLGLLLAGDMTAFNSGLAKLKDRVLAKKIEACLAEYVRKYKEGL